MTTLQTLNEVLNITRMLGEIDATINVISQRFANVDVNECGASVLLCKKCGNFEQRDSWNDGWACKGCGMLSSLSSIVKPIIEMSGIELCKTIQNMGKNDISDSTKIIKIIEEGKAQVDYVDNNGNTPLIHACSRGMADVALALIATNKSKPDHIRTYTALIYACRYKLTDVALALIKTGLSNPEFIAYDDTNALFLACENNLTDVALEIIKTGKVKLNYANRYGKTALECACYSQLADVITKLIEDDNVDLVFRNSTALIEIIKRKNRKIALKLIKSGRSKPGTIIMDGTALILACENNLSDVALAIIETGYSKPHHISKCGENALLIAYRNTMFSVIDKIRAIPQ